MCKVKAVSRCTGQHCKGAELELRSVAAHVCNSWHNDFSKCIESKREGEC